MTGINTAKVALLGAGAVAATAGLVYWARRRAHEAEPLDRGIIDALDALDLPDGDALDAFSAPPEGGDYVEVDVVVDDVGELYGVHTPPASDTDLGYGDDYRGVQEGDNWLESLELTSTEGGPTPEHEVDVVDEDDLHHPHSDTRDRPIADKGAGGRGGL